MSLLLLLALLGDGWTRLSRGEEAIEVYRDAWGIPHVFAKTPAGAFWAEGYTEAEDRLGQMETFRRAARGEIAEIQGRAGVANDLDRARRGYTSDELERLVQAAGPRTREAFGAYAEGVNVFLETLPEEKRPRPWKESDSMAVSVMMARRFGEAGGEELEAAKIREKIVEKVGEEAARLIVADLLRENDPSAPTTLLDHRPDAPRKEGGRVPAPGMSDEAYARYCAELGEIRASREALGVPATFGSNAWVASPARSASGNAMLYGGPMMGFRSPSICNEVHLSAEGLNAAGMSFPGLPGVMIGWNDRLAWTTTSGGADLVDVYTLELNPDNPGQYRYQGEWKDFEVFDREIRVKDGDPVAVKIHRSVHGPLLGEPDVKRLRAHAMRMSFWMREHEVIEGMMEVNVARTIEDFRGAMGKIVTSHNFFCATADGHIGFWYCGAHPVRTEGHASQFPQPGDGSMEWVGFLPFEKWPQAVDPPSGLFANWNNKPSRDWPSTGLGKVFWGKKIIDVLEEKEKIGFDRFTEIARLTAYHAYIADYFKPFMLEAAEGSRAFAILKKWDHQASPGAEGPEIASRWVQGMIARLFNEFIDPPMAAHRGVQRQLINPLLAAFEGRPLRYDYLKGRDLRELARKCLEDVMKADPERLKWKEPEVDFEGDVGKVPSSRGRGTYQMAVEMTPEGPRAVTLAAPGQSERPDSPHHKDQLEMFRKWEVKPFVFRREEMK